MRLTVVFRSRQMRLSLALMTALAVAIAGCSAETTDTPTSEPSHDQVQSSDSSGPQPTAKHETLEEWNEAVIRCLHDEGWTSARLTTDGNGVGLEVPEVTAEQRPAFQLVLDQCNSAAGAPPNSDPLSEAEISEIYTHLLGAVVCLEEQGFNVAEPPPSEAVFMEDYLSGEPPWSPFLGLPAMSQTEWDSLMSACPQTPWE